MLKHSLLLWLCLTVILVAEGQTKQGPGKATVKIPEKINVLNTGRSIPATARPVAPVQPVVRKPALAPRMPQGMRAINLNSRLGRTANKPMTIYRPVSTLNTHRSLSFCDTTVVLTRQSQIDSFPVLFSGCTSIKTLRVDGRHASPAITRLDSLYPLTEVTVDLEISRTAVTDLAALNNITRVGSYIFLDSNYALTSTSWTSLTEMHGFIFIGSPLLTDMNGLFSNLNNTDLWSVIFSNLGLSDFTAFSPIQSVINFSINSCPNITNLNGFHNLAHADFGMQFFDNAQLSDISVLDQITTTNYLQIYSNPALTSLSGLQNIVTMNGNMEIVNNNALTTLNDFNSNLVVLNNQNPNDTLWIRYNNGLSTCSAPFLCDYLSNGRPALIEGNAPGCEDLAAVQAACPAACANGDTLVWNGIQSADWNDTLNWTPHRLPVNCTHVFIPGGIPNDPQLSNPIHIGGLTIENGNLYTEGYPVQVKYHFRMENAAIYGFGTIDAREIAKPKVEFSYLEGDFSCRGYTDTASFISNYFNGNVILSDSSIRNNGYSMTYFNTFVQDLTFINNSDYGQMYLSNASPFYDEVFGKLTVSNNSAADISVALGGGKPLRVHGDAEFNIPQGAIDINNIAFTGNNTQHLIQGGSEIIRINNLFLDKVGGGELVLDQDVLVKNSLNFTMNGGFIRSDAAGKVLLLGPDCITTGFTPSIGSFVDGPVKKTGNTAFEFPVGDIQSNTAWTAPIRISAPQNNLDEFQAEYIHKNPATDGYDTAQYTAGFGGISGREYWKLNRMSGSSDVTVTLSYDSLRSGPIYDLSRAQIAGWNGSQWTSWLNGGTTGNYLSGTIQSATPLTTYGPLTLSAKPIRKPVITIGTIDTLPCIGGNFIVRYSLDTNMVTGNNFIVQLSDTAGNFGTLNPILGSKQSSALSDSILCVMPFNAVFGKPYRIRIVGNLPPDTSVNAPVIRPFRAPQLSFNIVGPDSVCAGTSQAYTISPKENGASYNWTIAGGSFSISNDTAFVTWNTAGQYSLFVVASNKCGNGPTKAKTVTVRPPAPTAAPVLTQTGRWLFSSDAAPAQNATGYRWFRNDTLINGANNNSYYAAVAGNYTVRYFNACGNGPASNTISFAADALPQTISFPVIADKVYGDAPFALNATSSSGLPVQLQIISGPGNLTSGVFTITGTGTVTIRATQAGDALYDTAAPVTRSFIVTKAAQTISFAALPDLNYNAPAFQLNATSNSGLPISYTLNSGPAVLNSNVVTLTGLGTVSITAAQAGDTNYLAAAPVTQSFCVRVNELNTITGSPFVCPGQTATYTINSIPGLTYSWRLSNGTTYASNTNQVNITWSTAGTYTLIVSATGPCGLPTANDSLVVNVINAVSPGAVSNMLPADGTGNIQLPLTLSWQPGSNALNYDLYVWDSASVQPATPFAANITGINYTIPVGAFVHNKGYKWRVVSKNACLQTSGPIQGFRLKPLPDLVVANVQAPAAANSGQTIAINWTVKNAGPGNTGTSQSWTDAVFLTFDTTTALNIPPNTNPNFWSQFDFPVRPLLIGTKTNVAALDSGQQYTNSINFTIPVNYGLPLYAYVVTNYAPGASAPLEMTLVNDTARAANAIDITLSPTPDLRVDTVVVPSSTFSGSTINVAYRVKNYGALVPAGGQWTDRFYISPSPLFNLSNAILLKRPKANGTYYPGAADAAVTNSFQLQTDSSVSRNTQVVIPNFLSGTYFIHVFTNNTNTLYEGALANNNTGNSVIQVFLTPTPQLTINSLNVPFSTASVTQPLGVNWNVFNAGFADNMEKNKGHYFVRRDCITVPGGIAGTNYVDSLGYGGSYWTDRIYLSTDSANLNTSTALLLGERPQGILNSGLFSPDNLLASTACGFNAAPPAQYAANVLSPGSNHPQTFNFTMPAHLPPGNYYLYVYTNPDKQVYEFPDTPSIRRSALPVQISRPDLTVPSVTVPAAVTGGQTFTINYSIQNNGPGAVFSSNRRDRVFISTSPVFDGSAVAVDTVENVNSLPNGSNTAFNTTYAFPSGVSGIRYIYIQTNYDSLFRETNAANNTSAASSIVVSAAPPADLVVSNVIIADSIFTPASNNLRYTITNSGTAAATGEWTDSIFISCSPVYNPATVYFVQKRTQNRTLAPGDSFEDAFPLNLSKMSYDYSNCFAAGLSSPAYVFVKTNANGAVYEGALTGNNTSGSGLITIVNRLVDHIITTVTGVDTATVARPYAVAWTVKNTGQYPNFTYYNAWYDAVYFSPDSVFNANAVLGDNKYLNTTLANNQTYNETHTLNIPNLPAGDYYVWMVTNYSNNIPGELNRGNNANLIRNTAGAAKKIHIIRPLLPDLVDSITLSPSTVPVGQMLTIAHRITNTGPGITYPSVWNNDLWLSTDFIPGNAGDIRLTTKTRNGNLSAGQFYTDTVTAQVPLNTPAGNYLLLSVVDAGNALVENTDTNNVAFKPVSIYVPPASDLLVENIQAPDTILLGYASDTIRWVIRNNSPNSATGISADGLYFSKSSTLDSNAVLVSLVNKNMNLSPLAADTQRVNPVISQLTEGNYQVLVKTDLLNNIVETDKNNNTGVAVKQLFVKVKELVLGVTETNTLQSVSRIYKLRIADSLIGSTILVTLKTNDSLTMRNEMYVGGGYIPGPARFDYRFETPNYGNQQIVMSEVTDSVYYITVRCASAVPVLQNITLKAVKLPFAILNVNSNTGGNGGNVTVRINGSLYVPGMTATLSKPGTTITATAVYFINSTSVYATFPLQGRPLGVYDVTLTKPDAATTSLPGSFSIVSPNNGGLLTGGGVNTGPTGSGNDPGCDPGADAGLNSQLVTEVIIPEKVFAGWAFTIQIHFNNPTNMDVPAQTRLLTNDKNIPMALTQAGLTGASSQLYISFTEPGGPPGIIRAGGSGTLIIYSKAPENTPGHTFVNVSLK